MPGPLEGIKVLDFCLYVNGPSATMKLCDAGAEVLKVEPLDGSGERHQASTILEDGFNYQFAHPNRGKKSIALDLKSPDFLKIAEKLVKWCDVLTNNYRPGVLDRLGLSYEKCAEWNPKIVYCTNSGWGPVGELAQVPAFDGIAQAYSGAMIDNGGGPSFEPRMVGWAFSDEVGAGNFCQAILMAVVAQQRTGKGQKVDTSLLGATLSFEHFSLVPALHTGTQRDDGEQPMSYIKEVVYKAQCSDGKWLMSVPGTMQQWESFCKVIGREDIYAMTDDSPKRVAKKDEYHHLCIAEFLKGPRDEWVAKLQAAQVPAGPVNTFKEVAESQHAKDNGYIREQEVRGYGKRTVIGFPTKFASTPVTPTFGPAPTIGEHTGEYLQKMGFSAQDIQGFASRGSVGGVEDEQAPNPAKSKL